uniref:Uncharacterized protein n=1 Tax=Rhizophora mucronata TaxID=61149 RepID=A0A2P2P6K5_RHIMU
MITSQSSDLMVMNPVYNTFAGLKHVKILKLIPNNWSILIFYFRLEMGRLQLVWLHYCLHFAQDVLFVENHIP